MPIDALPERLQNPDAWKRTDMDNWYQKWILKYIHGWFSYGPRCKEEWAKWTVPPKSIFKIGGEGMWRYELDQWSKEMYLSRIQYWKRWHFQIQWPFMISFHFYFKNKSILNKSENSGSSVDNKLFYMYFGAHYDQDSVYWFPSVFVGLTWK